MEPFKFSGTVTQVLRSNLLLISPSFDPQKVIKRLETFAKRYVERRAAPKLSAQARRTVALKVHAASEKMIKTLEGNDEATRRFITSLFGQFESGRYSAKHASEQFEKFRRRCCTLGKKAKNEADAANASVGPGRPADDRSLHHLCATFARLIEEETGVTIGAPHGHGFTKKAILQELHTLVGTTRKGAELRAFAALFATVKTIPPASSQSYYVRKAREARLRAHQRQAQLEKDRRGALLVRQKRRAPS